MTPHDRLQKIIDAYTLPKMTYKITVGKGGMLFINGTEIQPLSYRDISDPLQGMLIGNVMISWDYVKAQHRLSVNVNSLWCDIKREITDIYEGISRRSSSTRRKTINFIHAVEPLDVLVGNFLIGAFIRMKSDSWHKCSKTEQETYVEKFELLRRTYGKK